LRIVQAVFSFIVLGLSAHILTWAIGGAPGYLLFVSIWTFLALAYIVFALIYASRLVFWKYAIFTVEVLTNFFWFTGFIAMAAVFGPLPCTRGDSIYQYSRKYTSACHTGKAAIAIAAFQWCSFIATSALLAIDIFG
ncbi:marvel domain-containing protein, partial [Lipomyces starkeyi]